MWQFIVYYMDHPDFAYQALQKISLVLKGLKGQQLSVKSWTGF